MQPCLLLTRPRDAALRFAAQLGPLARRVDLVVAPLTEIVFLPLPDLSGVDLGGVIFTSQYGVEGFARGSERRDLPAWCVGPRTASAAQAAGFGQVAQGAGDGAALLEQLIKARPKGVLLHSRGRHVALALADRLAAAGLAAQEAIVYAQRDCALDTGARARLCAEGDVIVPLFSPRSALLFAQALAGLDGVRARRHYVAISPAVGDAIAAVAGELQPVVAPAPDAEGMRRAIAVCVGELEQSGKPR